MSAADFVRASEEPSRAAAGPGESRLRRGARFAALGLGLVLCGGAGLWRGLIVRTPLAQPPRPARPLPAELDRRLRCAPDEPLDVVTGPELRVEGRRVLPGHLAVRREGQAQAARVHFRLYFADGVPRRAPAVVVTPILGGNNDIAKLVAADLSEHGFHAVIVERRFGKGLGNAQRAFPPTLEALEETFRDMIADRRRVIDWLETRPEVDPARIGAYGVSLGGITTVCLAAAEPRVRAAVAVMAGGDLAAVLARSVERECVRLARANGVDPPGDPEAIAAFEARARPILQTEPYALAPYVDPRRVLLFTTRRDTSVPTVTQERLWEALGRPERDSLPTGHYSAILYLPWILSRAREFLRRRLGAASN